MSPDEGQTDADILAAAITAAQQELSLYGSVENIKMDIADKYVYMQDFDLGDVCYVKYDNILPLQTKRIIEINEVWKENKCTITPQLGDRIPVLGRKTTVK